MTPDALFSSANTVALAAWLVLMIFQKRRWAVDVVAVAAVVLFASIYVAVIAGQWLRSDGGFGSLDGVATLFSNRWLLLAGWVHYLAFDLLVGRWEVQDAARLGISPWLVAPVLVLTFMFGPAGWLSYMVVRAAAGRGPTSSTLVARNRRDAVHV
jgi:hypothetical protein